MNDDLTNIYADLRPHAVADVKGEKVPLDKLVELEENSDIWFDSLIALKKEVELQLVDKRIQKEKEELTYKNADKLNTPEWIRYINGYNEWRVKVLRFLVSIESKLRYVKRLRFDQSDK